MSGPGVGANDAGPNRDEEELQAQLETFLKTQAANMHHASGIAVAEYAKRFAGWDRNRVVGLLVAACFEPRNAWLGMRLTIALHAAAGLTEGGVHVPTGVLKQALDKGGQATAQHLEDPLEGPFIWPIKFDEPARFLGAPIPDDVFFLDAFWEAAQRLEGDAGAKLRDILRITGRIAETMAVRASAPNSAGPGIKKAQGVAFPKPAFRENFTPDWTIGLADVEGGLERPAEAKVRLASITTNWEIVRQTDPEGSPLLIRPLVQQGERWLVLCPLHLARAAMHAALETAKANGIESAYRAAVEDTLVEHCVKWCDRLGWIPVDHKIAASEVDEFKVGTVTFRTSARSIVRVVIMAGVPPLGAFQDLDQAPQFRLPAKAGATGLSTMFSGTKIEFEPNRLRQLFVIAGPACNAAVRNDDVLPGAEAPEILALPNLVGLFFNGPRDPRRFLRYWDAHAQLHARGVNVVPDDFASYCAWNKKETFYLSDDTAPTMMHLDGSFVSNFWQETMDRAQPSFATRGTKSYQRFKQGHEPEFTIFSRQDGAHEIEHHGQLFCVVTSDEEHREIARMLSFWTWRLSLGLKQPIVVVATVAINGNTPANISTDGHVVTVALGTDFQPDEDTEASLSIAATHAIRIAYGDAGAQEAERLRQELLGNPLHRHQRVADDPTMQEGITDSGEERVREAYRDSLMDWIGPRCIEQFKLTPGTLPNDQAKIVTDWIWRQTLGQLQKGINGLNGPQSLTVALRLHEQILHRGQMAEFHQPYDEALWAMLPTFHEEHLEQWKNVQRDALSTRFFVECLVATSPEGKWILDEESFELLISIGSSIADWGFADEVLHFGQDADAKVECLKSNRVALSMKTSQAIRLKLAEQQMLGGVRSYLAESKGAPKIETATFQEIEPLLDDCMKGRAGYTLNEFTECIKNWVAASFDKGGDVVIAARAEMLAAAKVSAVSAGKVLDDMALMPRGGILGKAGVELKEIVPWSFNRDQSLLWRPICFDGTNYQYAARLLLEAVQYQFHQYLQGRGPTDGPCARLYEFVEDRRGKALTNAVAALYTDANRYVVAKGFKGKPGVTFPPELGDIDVLVFDKKKNRIEVMEAKNYFLAKTPREIQSQHEKLFLTVPGKKACMADKHERRVKWVKDNLNALLASFKLAGDWTVRDCMVMAGYTHHALAQNRVTVVSFSDLRHRFASGKMSA